MFGQSAKHDIMIVEFLLILPLTNSCSDQPEGGATFVISLPVKNKNKKCEP